MDVVLALHPTRCARWSGSDPPLPCVDRSVDRRCCTVCVVLPLICSSSSSLTPPAFPTSYIACWIVTQPLLPPPLLTPTPHNLTCPSPSLIPSSLSIHPHTNKTPVQVPLLHTLLVRSYTIPILHPHRYRIRIHRS